MGSERERPVGPRAAQARAHIFGAVARSYPPCRVITVRLSAVAAVHRHEYRPAWTSPS